MPRYYESESLIDFVKQNTPHMNGETTMKCVEFAIKNAPTADVVPKSEVENIISNQRQRLNEYKKQIVTLQEKLEQAKAEVAREIFEEIENEIDSVIGLNFALQSLDHFITELKKKYTEVSTDENL